MLQPVRTKWRKAHKGRIHGNATRASTINYGAYALKALQPERVTGKQIEAARVALTRHMKRQGRVWTRIFPNIPVSKKPIEVRMGKGKGSPEYFQTYLYQKNQLRLEWEKVKVHLNFGHVELNQVEYYLKLMEFQKKLLKRLYTRHLQNFLLKQKQLKDLLK